MSAQNTKKNYKFAFSGIVAILAGLVIAALTYLDFISEINSTFAKVSELPYPPINYDGLPIAFPSPAFYYSIEILRSILQDVRFITNLSLVLSLLSLGILLIAKQHKPILLISPALGMFGVLSYIWIYLSNFSGTNIKTPFSQIIYDTNLDWLFVLAAFVLFFIFVKTSIRSKNDSKERKSLSLAWVASATAALGYTIITFNAFNTLLWRWSEYGFDLKFINIDLITNAVSIFIYPTVFILAGLWIANPYKKNARTEFEAAETSKTANAPKVAAPANVKTATSEKLGSQFDEKVDALKKCKELLDMNILTQEEFEEKKKQILGL